MVGGVSVGVVGLLASVLAVASVLEASEGRSAGLSAAMGPPSRLCRHEMRQIQLDASVSNVSEPSSIWIRVNDGVCNVYATAEVRRRFNAIGASYPLILPRGQAAALKIKAGLALDALQTQIQKELGSSEPTAR